MYVWHVTEKQLKTTMVEVSEDALSQLGNISLKRLSISKHFTMYEGFPDVEKPNMV